MWTNALQSSLFGTRRDEKGGEKGSTQEERLERKKGRGVRWGEGEERGGIGEGEERGRG